MDVPLHLRHHFPRHQSRNYSINELCTLLGVLQRQYRGDPRTIEPPIPVSVHRVLSYPEGQRCVGARQDEIAVFRIGHSHIVSMPRIRGEASIFFSKRGTGRLFMRDVSGNEETKRLRSWRACVKEIYAQLVWAYKEESRRAFARFHDLEELAWMNEARPHLGPQGGKRRAAEVKALKQKRAEALRIDREGGARRAG